VTTVASFHLLADRELNDAAQFYETQSPGLGAAFLDDAANCVSAIATHPQAGRVLRGDVRRRLLRRFPFALIYRIRPDGIRVLAVMNLRRRPHYWTGRE
jgi:plasmid stabilization system protein ParE